MKFLTNIKTAIVVCFILMVVSLAYTMWAVRQVDWHKAIVEAGQEIKQISKEINEK